MAGLAMLDSDLAKPGASTVPLLEFGKTTVSGTTQPGATWEELLRSLQEPYVYRSLLGQMVDAEEVPLIRPKRTFRMSVFFHLKGRGEPAPYPWDDDDIQ